MLCVLRQAKRPYFKAAFAPFVPLREIKNTFTLRVNYNKDTNLTIFREFDNC